MPDTPAEKSTPIEQKLLSICIPQWSRLEWLKACLGAICAQNDPRIEIWVGDDGIRSEVPVGGASEAETRAALDGFRGDNLHYFRRTDLESTGIFYNARRLIKHATGKFVWIIGNDDLILPGGIAHVLDCLSKNSDLDYFFVNYGAWWREFPPGDGETIAPDRIFNKDGKSRRLGKLLEIAAVDPNAFTPMYANLMSKKRWEAITHRLDGITETVDPTVPCPMATYVIEHLLHRPAFLIGGPYLIVSHNASWRPTWWSRYWVRNLAKLRHRIRCARLADKGGIFVPLSWIWRLLPVGIWIHSARRVFKEAFPDLSRRLLPFYRRIKGSRYGVTALSRRK